MSTIKILLIDDDDVDREQLQRLIALFALPYEITEASSGRQGLELLRQHSYDCVLLDYALGDITGIEFLRDVLQTRSRPFPVIMITGLGDIHVAVEAMREGVFDYLTKARLDSKRLIEAIEGSLRWAEMQGELHETRERLSEQTRLFQSIMRHMSDGIMVVDQEGRLLVINPAAEKILGCLASDLDLVHWTPAFGVFRTDQSTPWPAAEWPLMRAVRGESTSGVEMYVRHRAGPGGVFIECRACPLLDENNGVKGGIVAFNDITASYAVARMKDEFISIVSHELRTPLTAIKGALGLLVAGTMGEIPSEAMSVLEIALNNTDRQIRLINEILDMERLESGGISMKGSAVDAYALMLQAGEGVRPLADKAAVQVIISPVKGCLWANADRIVQVLINLLGNAIKFSPAGSSVWLTAERTPLEMNFQVRDNGRGIPADKLEMIFGRFQQVEPSDSRQHGGTGLGLAISRSIITQHGGRIWAESAGHGSTFFFTVPLFLERSPGP